ncbi:FadR/GntR family transcriptional regulator [Amnibacterium flavum]|uniref:GntR family transcriptional regulator n=1 Tax=Amnibacterium flavum TaxID=2173173 RepID=A0A2V1HUN8_9MICO|nr:FCD domain-containing protein [Amnibacterium flavum]PVZ93804.1 GntR family transcriptional regulator [Amnibacterium flavum]
MAVYPGRGLHGEVVGILGLRIIRGDYPPHSTIDIDGLEPELGVSKTVIREALKVLGAKGLVDSRPKRGTFVRGRDAWSLLDTDIMMWRREAQRDDDRLLADLSELRDAIEPAAARLAATRRTDADIERLESAFEAFAAAGQNVEMLGAADLEFHLTLLQATHNELYAQLDVVITHALEARNRIQHHPDAEWMDPVPDHQAVLDAVRAGDPAAAERAIRHALRDSDEDLRAGEPPFDL